MSHFADRLIDTIARKNSPICVGLDPIFEKLPNKSGRDPLDPQEQLDAIYEFTAEVLQIVAPIVPCVKFQSAYFERYRWEGVQAYYELVAEARQLGLLVIGDVKRGDIGSTSEAYADAHLNDNRYPESEEALAPDAITVNPMLGMDTLQPFIDATADHDKGLFVLVRTSNPGSALTQDVKLADGRTWSEMLAEALSELAEKHVGSSAFSSIGAVVGATQPGTMQSLRKRLPRSIFLLPGYGTQGGTADMTRSAFIDGKGVLVSASRSILYPKAPDGDWKSAVANATKSMQADLASILS